MSAPTATATVAGAPANAAAPASSAPPPSAGLEVDVKLREQLLTAANQNEVALRTLAFEDAQQCGWKFVSDNSAVTIYRKPSADGSGGFCFRGTGLVPASPRDALALLWDLERKREYDSFFASYRIVADLTADTQVNLQTSVSYPLVAPREFLYLAHKSMATTPPNSGGSGGGSDETTAVLSAQTIECDSLCPPRSGYVRGTVKASGFVIESVPNQPTTSRLTFVCDMRLNGSLPSFVTTKVLADTPSVIAKLRPILQRITNAAATTNAANATAPSSVDTKGVAANRIAPITTPVPMPLPTAQPIVKPTARPVSAATAVVATSTVVPALSSLP